MSANPFEKTYCNPLPLSDYPRGRYSHNKQPGLSFRHAEPHDFRELADPTVLYLDGKWIMYPSGGMAYVSDDFHTWKHVPIQPPDIGYAPTVARFRDKFLMTALCAPMYQADGPLGPFEKIGPVLLPNGKYVDNFFDPMIFPDDDGRLYIYWGLGGPIYGGELNPDQPNQLITEPKPLLRFNPANEWERLGDWNEDPSSSCTEGAWMFKAGGRYYLTYVAPGTEFRTYAMGAYVSDQPLGTFRYQERNPILRTTTGLVRGPGHGCITRGPNDTIWAFYTCLLCYEHIFERRIGMDPAGIDADGNLFVRGATEIPQWAPGVIASPENGNDAGLLPLTMGRPQRTSSAAPGREGIYALDGSMLTWWQPMPDDSRKTLTVYIRGPFNVSASRIVWRDVALDYDHGVVPGPFQYKIEACPDDKETADNWETVLDCTKNHADLAIDYRTFAAVKARKLRLTITGAPKGVQPGVIDFTVFGKYAS